SYLAARKWTIYEKQVKSKIDSPAHAGDFFVDILQAIKVKDLMHLVKKVSLISQDMPFLDFKEFFSKTKQHYFPVMDKDERLVGIFSSTDIREVIFSQEIEHLVVMQDIAISDIIVATPSEDLNSVLRKFTIKNIDSLPVVKDDDHGILVGMLNRREVISFYNEQIQKIKNKAEKYS
ncbi:MAG: CBS domain-containing protein, partial [Proteobacteria bacterium]|nr:CBS domain-containing protein [Pseudomonadota bacterium]